MVAEDDFDLGVLAGGDIYEWAVNQVAQDHRNALLRLRSEYPWVWEEESCDDGNQ